MNNPLNDKQLFLDMQEHPESYSDKQLETMMTETDCNPDTDAAWKRFEKKHFNSKQPMRQWLKMAAVFAGIIFLAGITYAAIHLWGLFPTPYPKGEENSYTQDTIVTHSTRPSTGREDGSGTESIVFDNVTLEEMLAEFAAHYQVEVEFQNDNARQLRFYFAWKHEETIEHVVNRLNRFESIDIVIKDKKITVK